jgi:hypothetical protein
MALRVISRRCDSLVAAGGIADIGSRWSPEDSVANDESPGGISPRALPDPCVNLSIHTAPDVRPLP